MTDELSIPQVPDAKPDDPEDVSWALSTAEAMWARGDHSEGIKWVRRAAEAASEAEDDGRALELAKAAADLQGMMARASERSAGGPPPVPSKPKAQAPSKAPPAPASGPPAGRSIPPVGKTSAKPPPPRASVAPPAPTPSQTPPKPSGGRSIPPIAAGPRTSATSTPPPAPRSGPAEKKGRRKSREGLEHEARVAGLLDTAPHPVISAETAALAAAGSERRSPPESDPTMVAAREDIDKRRQSSRSAAEWDAIAATHTPNADDVDGGDRKTALGIAIDPGPQTRAAPKSIPPRAGSSRPSVVPHDQSIQTSQAVRVVVWRDANGVHVGPVGTVVSAIKIEAVLVALEPTADLTAWLSAKTR